LNHQAGSKSLVDNFKVLRRLAKRGCLNGREQSGGQKIGGTGVNGQLEDMDVLFVV